MEYGGWRVKKKLVGRKILSVMKLEGENWSVEGGGWSVEGGMVAHAPIPTRTYCAIAHVEFLSNYRGMSECAGLSLFILHISIVTRMLQKRHAMQ